MRHIPTALALPNPALNRTGGLTPCNHKIWYKLDKLLIGLAKIDAFGHQPP